MYQEKTKYVTWLIKNQKIKLQIKWKLIHLPSVYSLTHPSAKCSSPRVPDLFFKYLVVWHEDEAEDCEENPLLGRLLLWPVKELTGVYIIPPAPHWIFFWKPSLIFCGFTGSHKGIYIKQGNKIRIVYPFLLFFYLPPFHSKFFIFFF